VGKEFRPDQEPAQIQHLLKMESLVGERTLNSKNVKSNVSFQLTEDMVITDSGQNARKSVGEESEPGRDSVTALLLRMVVRSVLVTKVKLRFVTRTLVQLTVIGEHGEIGQNVQRSVREVRRLGIGNVMILHPLMEELSARERTLRPGTVTLNLAQLRTALDTGLGRINMTGEAKAEPISSP